MCKSSVSGMEKGDRHDSTSIVSFHLLVAPPWVRVLRKPRTDTMRSGSLSMVNGEVSGVTVSQNDESDEVKDILAVV